MTFSFPPRVAEETPLGSPPAPRPALSPPLPLPAGAGGGQRGRGEALEQVYTFGTLVRPDAPTCPCPLLRLGHPGPDSRVLCVHHGAVHVAALPCCPGRGGESVVSACEVSFLKITALQVKQPHFRRKTQFIFAHVWENGLQRYE